MNKIKYYQNIEYKESEEKYIYTSDEEKDLSKNEFQSNSHTIDRMSAFLIHGVIISYLFFNLFLEVKHIIKPNIICYDDYKTDMLN